MYDYDVFSVESKAEVLEKSREFWNPGKTDFWSETGVDLVIDRREDYFIWDMSGLRLIDVHLNGGTFNLGHRDAEPDQGGVRQRRRRGHRHRAEDGQARDPAPEDRLDHQGLSRSHRPGR